MAARVRRVGTWSRSQSRRNPGGSFRARDSRRFSASWTASVEGRGGRGAGARAPGVSRGPYFRRDFRSRAYATRRNDIDYYNVKSLLKKMFDKVYAWSNKPGKNSRGRPEQ